MGRPGGALYLGSLFVLLVLLRVAHAVAPRSQTTKAKGSKQDRRRTQSASCTQGSDCPSGSCDCSSSSGRRLFGAPISSCSCAPVSPPPPPSPPPPSPPPPARFQFSSSQVIDGVTVTCASISNTATYTQCDGLVAQGYAGFQNGVACDGTWKSTNPSATDLIGFCQSLVGSSSTGHSFFYRCTTTASRSTWNAGIWGMQNDNGLVDGIKCMY